jgi:arginine/ornithine N-succinyltransferase beta subunit
MKTANIATCLCWKTQRKKGSLQGHVALNHALALNSLSTPINLPRSHKLRSSWMCFSKHSMLQVTNDLTGCSEIGALFLLPEYRRDRIGKMLSLSRFLFIAAHPDYIAEQVIAEMRGVHDNNGDAPFYNSIAHHFFQMPFAKADYINATQGNQFINDLMPKYPHLHKLAAKSRAGCDWQGQPRLGTSEIYAGASGI